MLSKSALDNEGVLLAQRLVTMRLTDFTPDEILQEILDNKEHAASALMFLATLASRKVTLETWQESLLGEQHGI